MDELKERVTAKVQSGELAFKGARKRHNLAPGAYGILAMTALEWAKENAKPRAAAITKACAAYWELYEERKTK